MKLRELLAELKKVGTAQNVKVYSRHGVKGPMFGVSYANQGKFSKKIGTDQELARSLWKSGNHDARVLATMIADPAVVTASELDAWLRDCDNYVLTDALSAFVVKTKHAQGKFEKWSKSKQEFVAQAGWSLLTTLATQEGIIAPAELLGHLGTIEAEIHERPNRTRHAMNMALIGIGLRNKSLRKKAEAASRRIGPVDVDHGETSCTTPDPVPYLERAWQRKDAKAPKAKAKKA